MNIVNRRRTANTTVTVYNINSHFFLFLPGIFPDGVVIPKGVTCWINIYTMHRNEKYFPKPEEFIPERFLTEEFGCRHPFCYIPFSAGSKNCIGE